MADLLQEMVDTGRKLVFHQIDISKLKEGDHIFAVRKAFLYTHHGIYVGNDRVIHYLVTQSKQASEEARACKKCGYVKHRDLGGVKTCLDCFLSDDDFPLTGTKLYLYRYGLSKLEYGLRLRVYCTTLPSKPSKEVVETANKLLGKKFGSYNLVSNNCEDFATFCKTGTARSSQVEQWFGSAGYYIVKQLMGEEGTSLPLSLSK